MVNSVDILLRVRGVPSTSVTMHAILETKIRSSWLVQFTGRFAVQ